jgi:hypothetical protein
MIEKEIEEFKKIAIWKAQEVKLPQGSYHREVQEAFCTFEMNWRNNLIELLVKKIEDLEMLVEIRKNSIELLNKS